MAGESTSLAGRNDYHDGFYKKWRDQPLAHETDVEVENIIAALPAAYPDEPSFLLAVSPTPKDASKNSPPALRKLIWPTESIFFEHFRLSDSLKVWRRQNSQFGNHEGPHLHVVISTGSGTGLAPGTWRSLVQPLFTVLGLSERLDYEVHYTKSETSITDFAREVVLPIANRGSKQTIVLLSGDGGVVDMVNALLSQPRTAQYVRPTIGLMPLGTGNALANSSGINNDATLGLRTLLRGSPKSLPMFRATFSRGARLVLSGGSSESPLEGEHDGLPAAYGAVVASWGLHAGLVADSDTAEYRRFGAERFKMAAKEALFPADGGMPHAYRGKLSVRRPGRTEWEGMADDEHGYVLATLVSCLEAGFTISPASRPLDGRLHLVQFAPLAGSEAVEIMGAAYHGGKHVEDERVRYEEIEAMRIEFNETDARWRRVCIDGKIVVVEEGGWLEVEVEVQLDETERVVDLVA